MKHRTVISIVSVLLVLLFAQAPSTMAQTKSPNALSGEKIIDKFVEVTGGKAAFDKVTSRINYGSMELMPGMKATIVTYQARPNKMRLILAAPQMGNVERGYDGQTFWERTTMTGARLIEGDELKSALREDAVFDKFADWKSMYDSAILAGTDTVNGSTCSKVQLFNKGDQPQTWFFDQTSGLLTKITMMTTTQMGSAPADIAMSDYRAVDGLQTPFKMTISAAGMEQKVLVDSIVQNKPIPDSIFAAPAEIQELIKQKAAEKK